MNAADAPDAERSLTALTRATVTDMQREHATVICENDSSQENCDLLCGSGSSVCFVVGDQVLVWRPPSRSGRPVILGRIASPAEARRQISDELVIEAGTSLTLKVGDGSITIREDGKILIKGTHLVSHAKKMNRIRGGSVAVN